MKILSLSNVRVKAPRPTHTLASTPTHTLASNTFSYNWLEVCFPPTATPSLRSCLSWHC